MFEFLDLVTLGQRKKFFKTVLLVSLSDLFNFSSIFFICWIIYQMFSPWLDGSEPEGLAVAACAAAAFMLLSYFIAVPGYRSTYIDTYRQSAAGRLQLAEHIRKLSAEQLAGLDPERISRSMMNDFADLETVCSHLLPEICSAVFVCLLVAAGLTIYNWQIALCFFCCIPAAFLILRAVVRRSGSMTDTQRKTALEASSNLSEFISGIATFKANCMGGAKFSRLTDSFEQLRKQSLRLEVTMMPFALMAMSCMGSGIGILVFAGQYFIASGTVTPVEFLCVTLIAARSIVPMLTFSVEFLELQYFAGSAKKIRELMMMKQMEGKSAGLPAGSDLQLDRVCYRYPSAAKDALSNVSLSIPAGTSVAIVGPSGGGKSTLLRLIARCMDPTSGQIRIGDPASAVCYTDLDPEELNRKFSIVFQNTVLFNGSVRFNVTLGDESFTREQVENALKTARVDFATQDDLIAEYGQNLSGGERQRICIARCLLRKAPVVLLDEVTSSLDVWNSRATQQAISSLAGSGTVIVIAHRLQSVTDYDRIIFVENGSIVEEGTHGELLALNGRYRAMWEAELHGFSQL
jgi:ATP-binding cassette subfamily B protein